MLGSPLSPTNSTFLSTALSRTLCRRYFLLNKTRLATTIPILIETTSSSLTYRRLLARTRRSIEASCWTAYTVSVGKLASSSSKVTNFAEIEAFVLLAYRESAVERKVELVGERGEPSRSMLRWLGWWRGE